jgi:hypothetical protein
VSDRNIMISVSEIPQLLEAKTGILGPIVFGPAFLVQVSELVFVGLLQRSEHHSAYGSMLRPSRRELNNAFERIPQIDLTTKHGSSIMNRYF